MKKLILTTSIFASCLSYADLPIALKKLSSSKECQNIGKLVASDNLRQFRNFSISSEDYLTVKLLDRENNACYSFKYYPNISPHLNVSIENNKLMINEIAGSTLNGNQISILYLINLKQKKLILLESKMITYNVDEKGNIVKIVSKLIK